MSRLERLNEARGEKSAKVGGTGLKSTWKKLKGKKKKQRNLTAPEIRPGQLLSVGSVGSDGSPTLTPVKESDSDGSIPGGKDPMGKRSGSREKVNAVTSAKAKKHGSKESSGKVGKLSPKGIRRWSIGQKDERSRTDSPSSTEDASLSQKSETRLSDEHDQLLPASKQSTTDQSVFDHSDLSQASKLSLSQPGTFLTNEEPLSTQSSSEVHIQLSPVHPAGGDTEGGVANSDIPNGHAEGSREEEESEISRASHEERGSSSRSFRLYTDFGAETHQLNLKKVKGFLESSGETEPVDLSNLREWDGWTLASREIV